MNPESKSCKESDSSMYIAHALNSAAFAMKGEKEDGKEYVGGAEVQKINSHVGNKGPRSSWHKIHRPTLLLLVSSFFHDCLPTLGSKTDFNRPVAKDRTWSTIHV